MQLVLLKKKKKNGGHGGYGGFVTRTLAHTPFKPWEQTLRTYEPFTLLLKSSFHHHYYYYCHVFSLTRERKFSFRGDNNDDTY